MPDNTDVSEQLQLLGDLRDLLERWLDLAKPEQRNIGQVRDLLLEIQKSRNELLELSMMTASFVIAQHLRGSRTVLGTSIELLRSIAGPLSPLHKLAQDYVRRVDLLSGPHGTGGGSDE